jgi:hypothetical protein
MISEGMMVVSLSYAGLQVKFTSLLQIYNANKLNYNVLQGVRLNIEGNKELFWYINNVKKG